MGLERRIADIQDLQDRAQTGQQVGEGTHLVSWIWTMPGVVAAAVLSDASCHEGTGIAFSLTNLLFSHQD